MANCIKCGKSCEQETVFYVMEWSDNVVGSRQVQQAGIRGAVKAGLCSECMAAYVAGRTKGLFIPKKEKEAAKAALGTGDFTPFAPEAVSDALKERINAPNVGKSKAFVAWAQANAADHLVDETFIPAEYVAACLTQDANGSVGFVAHEPIRYILARPSVFKFIQYDKGKFEFVANERWIDPKWLMASEDTLRACREYLAH